MTTQLMNFNIPTDLKSDLDRLAKHRNVSRTAIIITLIESYCRSEWREIEANLRLQQRVEAVRRSTVADGTEAQEQEPPMPFFDNDGDWEGSYDFAT